MESRIFQVDNDWSDIGDGILVWSVNDRPYLVKDELQQGNPYTDEMATRFRDEFIRRHIEATTGWRVCFDHDVHLGFNRRLVKACSRRYEATYAEYRAIEAPDGFRYRGEFSASEITGFSSGWDIVTNAPYGMHPAHSQATWQTPIRPGDKGLMAIVEMIGWKRVVEHIINSNIK